MQWLMPDLGEGVQEGEILQWLVKVGEPVKMDQALLEVMTDKATVELPSPFAGTLQKIFVKPGDIVKIKTTLAEIQTSVGDRPAPVKEAEKAKGVEKKIGVIASQGIATPRHGGASTFAKATADRRDDNGMLQASPAVRRMARERGVDLKSLQGSGPDGRVLISDLNILSKAATVSSATSSSTLSLEGIDYGSGQRIPLRGLRRKISEHMSLSRKMAAHFTHVDEADVTALVEYREKQKEEATRQGVKLTFLPYIMKAAVQALKKYPYLNASLDENSQEIVLKNYYHIGFAAATDEGLIVPHVNNVDQLSVFQLAGEIKRLSEAVRARKAKPEELKGGTFTVTNVGSIGGIVSMPIVNYPEVGILGIHKIELRPVVRNGDIVIRQMTYFSISADHRVVDGAYAAQFMNELIEILQKPETL